MMIMHDGPRLGLGVVLLLRDRMAGPGAAWPKFIRIRVRRAAVTRIIGSCGHSGPLGPDDHATMIIGWRRQ